MTRQWHPLIGIVIAGLTLTGCATIINQDYQDVPVTSQPIGSRVWLNEHPCGVTPVIVTLPRGETHIITVEQKGYGPYQISLVPMVSPMVWGNLLFGGLIGLGIDAALGGMYEYRPGQIHAFFPVPLQEQASLARLSGSEITDKQATRSPVLKATECDPYVKHPLGPFKPIRHG